MFHSFAQFSVPTGSSAHFNNAADVQNIISRVTGGSVSNIDGLISANGTANLFLINPNGIIFGRNASLNIGGSFVASTASSLKFADDTIFSATTPQTTPLLTISVPIGLQFGAIPKEIQLKNANLLNDPLNITRALIGGNVVLDNSGLRARGGRVELGGLAEAGTVNLAINNNDISLTFPPNTTRADVSLINSSAVNVRSGGGGSIVINANNLKMSEGSQLRAGINGPGTASSQAGDIKIDATGTITLDGAYSYISNAVINPSVGNGGNVDIKAGALSVTNGGQIYAGTYGRGNAGSVSINVRDTASFDGENQTAPSLHSGVFSKVESSGVGKGGNVNLQAGLLRLTNGALLEASSLGEGNAGSINIHARDIVFDGQSTLLDSSGVYSRIETAYKPDFKQGVGQGGYINITADSLSLTNGAVITTSTLGLGDAGNVSINARNIVLDGMGRFNGEFRRSSSVTSAVRDIGVGQGGSINVTTESLKVSNGASLSTSSFAQGNAGNLFINARNIVLDGVGSYLNEVLSYPSGVYSQVGTGAVGHGGYINVTADSLSVTNGAELTTSTQGNNNVAGSIKVAARSIRLDNKGAITATTRSGSGGNITLQNRDLLLMRRGSQISTSAGSEGQPADGGNIAISTPNGFIIAAPNENSDITANAFRGSGGRITINATGIYGITPLSREDLQRMSPNLDPSQVPTNDITAISQTSPEFSGTVQINTLGIDPTQGLVNLPVIPVDTKVAQGCTASGTQAQSEFIITGRGGLPPNPGEPLSTDAVSVNLVTLENPEARHEERNRATESQSHTREHPHKSSSANPPTQIVEAQGWIVNKNGDVELVAFAPTATPHNRRFNPASCQQERK